MRVVCIKEDTLCFLAMGAFCLIVWAYMFGYAGAMADASRLRTQSLQATEKR